MSESQLPQGDRHTAGHPTAIDPQAIGGLRIARLERLLAAADEGNRAIVARLLVDARDAAMLSLQSHRLARQSRALLE